LATIGPGSLTDHLTVVGGDDRLAIDLGQQSLDVGRIRARFSS
jgi:hypothetical protein